MKSIIIYYSATGNTKKAADIIAEYLKQKGETEIIALKELKNAANAGFSQGISSLFHKRTMIDSVKFDLGSYDLICLGTPVWAFGPCPAINTYLDKCFGLEGKKVVLFNTHSGMGNNRCLNYMQNILVKKGVKDFRRLCVQEKQVNDKALITLSFEEAVKMQGS